MTTINQLLNLKGHDYLSVASDETVYAAIEMMAKENVGSLLVTDGGNFSGIVTERDYARQIEHDRPKLNGQRLFLRDQATRSSRRVNSDPPSHAVFGTRLFAGTAQFEAHGASPFRGLGRGPVSSAPSIHK